jgi:N-acetylglucosamine-6-sulfatase
MRLADTATRALPCGALAALAAIAVLAAHPSPANAAAKPAKRPNVVMIVSDDQAVQTVRPDTMPNLIGGVASRGTSFTNAFVTTPLCCPSRAAMLSGQYAHNNGVLKNDYRQLRDKSNTLPVWLRRAGYNTIHVGKYLNLYRRAPGPESRPAPGWDVWQTIQEPNRYYDYELSINGREVRFGDRDSDYLTDVLNRKSARLARRYADRKRPFYLQLDHWAPHDSPGRESGPCHGGHDAVPAPTDESLFATEPLPKPPSFNEPDVDDKPSFIQRQSPVSAEVVELNYRCALASLAALDRGIAKLQRALKRKRELNDTVIVFVSDNGYFYGEHRLRYKVLPYEEALRVPLVISAPPRFLAGAQRPSTVDETVANIDLAPTILALAGASPCGKKGRCRVMDGRSLVPLLAGQDAGWPQDRGLAVEYTGSHHGFSSCSYRGIRAAGQLYVEHALVPDFTTGECVPARELEHYELANDPFQLDNLYPAPQGTPAAEDQEVLADRLATLRNCSGIPGRDPQQAGRPYCE